MAMIHFPFQQKRLILFAVEKKIFYLELMSANAFFCVIKQALTVHFCPKIFRVYIPATLIFFEIWTQSL